MEIRERLKEAMFANHTNIHQIFGNDKNLEAKAQRQMKGAALTTDILHAFYAAMPNISIEWLMTGEGKMKKDETYSTTEQPTNVASEETNKEWVMRDDVMVNIPLSLLHTLQDQIKIKDEQIAMLMSGKNQSNLC